MFAKSNILVESQPSNIRAKQDTLIAQSDIRVNWNLKRYKLIKQELNQSTRTLTGIMQDKDFDPYS